MITIESKKENINASDKSIFDYLGNFNNFETLVHDKIEDWHSDENSCRFSVKGLATIALRIRDKFPNSKIIVMSDGQSPVDFTLIFNIDFLTENSSVFYIEFLAEMNMLMSSMLKTPLQNFVDLLAKKLKEKYETTENC
ncbi:MAG: hypothetical protein PHT69_07190 [Bacteroidales bacterium]|nr:hypothetical protein [Bacteroidales bacterium]